MRCPWQATSPAVAQASNGVVVCPYLDRLPKVVFPVHDLCDVDRNRAHREGLLREAARCHAGGDLFGRVRALRPAEANADVDHRERDAGDRAERVDGGELNVVVRLVGCEEEDGV